MGELQSLPKAEPDLDLSASERIMNELASKMRLEYVIDEVFDGMYTIVFIDVPDQNTAIWMYIQDNTHG